LSFIYFILIELLINIFFSLNCSLLKDSILWFIFSGVIATSNSIHCKSSEELFSKHIISNLKFTLIFEFLVNFYVFPLFIEILIIPIVFIFEICKTALVKVEESSGKDFIVKVFNLIEISSGLLIIGFVILKCIEHYSDLLTTDIAFSFFHPLFLMILYFPFTYLWVLYSKYETLLVSIKTVFRNIKKENIGEYLRKRIISYSLLNMNRLNKIIENKYYFWINIESYDDVDLMITCYRHKIDKRKYS